MLKVETALGPWALLAALLGVEQDEGRVRAERWGPRTLDCDLVLYGGQRVDLPELQVPHPELPNRDFWIRELKELGLPAEGSVVSVRAAV
jgi:2-amino-4-hydroxy-6-hydroxymethyldihydropteridine diphosphokinase